MGLFKPAWMGKDEAKALRALDKVSDDETLFQIATECPHLSVRLRAVSKIKDSNVRLDVARTSRRVETAVREAALQGATEQQLHDVAVIDDVLMLFGIRLAAVRMMTDEALLADVAATEHSAYEADASLRAAAFSRVDDRELLLQLMNQYRDIYLGNVKRNPSVFQGSEAQGDKIIRDAVTDAYERIERPPFEWSMIMDGEKAATNLLLDLDGMSYTQDRDDLLRVALEKDGDVAAKAVSMLPYEQERGTLREIIARGKDEARMAALKKMRLPEDRDSVVACLSDHSAGKPVKLLAARLLPEDDPVLGERCCPNCGTVGSVERCRWWSEYFESYQLEFECRACKQSGESVFECDEPVDFSITLRELRDM